MYNVHTDYLKQELQDWLSKIPEGYELAGSKSGEYRGEQQLKLFLRTVN
tara:strand:+ start:635 stop:781 length:147 start_codon:yes stop_codon:yes gene_type:complete